MGLFATKGVAKPPAKSTCFACVAGNIFVGDHTTRQDDEGDQPSGGERTWANTGATRSDRGQRKTG